MAVEDSHRLALRVLQLAKAGRRMPIARYSCMILSLGSDKNDVFPFFFFATNLSFSFSPLGTPHDTGNATGFKGDTNVSCMAILDMRSRLEFLGGIAGTCGGALQLCFAPQRDLLLLKIAPVLQGGSWKKAEG